MKPHITTRSFGIPLPGLPGLLALCVLFAWTSTPLVAEESATAEWFAAMLEESTLEGTWAPLAAGAPPGAEKPDSYRVARAVPKGEDRWDIVWRVRRQGQEFEVPIPATVKFAGDTAVLILDAVPVGDGKVWSARVLFHDDSYHGRWWGGDGKGGTVNGIVRRAGDGG